jgi:hypothetical protein
MGIPILREKDFQVSILYVCVLQKTNFPGYIWGLATGTSRGTGKFDGMVLHHKDSTEKYQPLEFCDFGPTIQIISLIIVGELKDASSFSLLQKVLFKADKDFFFRDDVQQHDKKWVQRALRYLEVNNDNAKILSQHRIGERKWGLLVKVVQEFTERMVEENITSEKPLTSIPVENFLFTY